MALQECTLLLARLFVGLTMPCLVIMEPTLEITAPSMDTLVMFVKLGWTGKYQILRRREMELGNMAASLRDRKISDLERKRDGAGKYGRIFE